MGKSVTSFKKGQTGNPKGRPKKGTSQADLLRAALAAAGKGKGEGGKDLTFMQHICNRAYENDQVAIVILHKLLPNLKQVEIDQVVQAHVKHTVKQLPEEITRIIEYDNTG